MFFLGSPVHGGGLCCVSLRLELWWLSQDLWARSESIRVGALRHSLGISAGHHWLRGWRRPCHTGFHSGNAACASPAGPNIPELSLQRWANVDKTYSKQLFISFALQVKLTMRIWRMPSAWPARASQILTSRAWICSPFSWWRLPMRTAFLSSRVITENVKLLPKFNFWLTRQSRGCCTC